jgi:transcriptional regulator with XRE-family HTH domain
MDVKSFVGQNIRNERKKTGWSQEKLAVRADINSQYLSRLELGQENVKIETLQKIARALKIEIGQLFTKSK